MTAIVDAVKSGEIPDSEVAVVISDKADAAGLAKATERGVETVVMERRGRTREEHDLEIAGALRNRDVELVCLAGYMRLLSPRFIKAFPDRIVNIHPSLLPSFPGLDAQKQAIEHGVKISGCTVHFVNEDLDAGPIILQKWVEVAEDDTAETLSDRILQAEHELYVDALRHLAIEANSQSTSNPPKYKVLKSIAHNLSHSFVSFTNYVDDGFVIDDLRRIVQEAAGNRVSIRWVPDGPQHPALTPRILKSIEWDRQALMRMVHGAGALMSSIREFRTDIYLKKNRQIAVEGVLTDDRGRVYVSPVYAF